MKNKKHFFLRYIKAPLSGVLSFILIFQTGKLLDYLGFMPRSTNRLETILSLVVILSPLLILLSINTWLTDSKKYLRLFRANLIASIYLVLTLLFYVELISGPPASNKYKLLIALGITFAIVIVIGAIISLVFWLIRRNSRGASSVLDR